MLRDDLARARAKINGGIEWARGVRRAHFTKTAAIETAVWLAGAALMFPAALAVLMNRLSPFAPALFAAGLASGLPPVSMLLGCIWAIPVGPFSPESLAPAMGCLTSWGVSLVVKLVLGQEPDEREGRDIRMAASAAIGALMPALIMAKGLLYNILAACTSAVVAAAVAPCVYPALMLRRGRERLLPDERLALFLYGSIAMLGGGALPGLLRHMPLIIASFVMLIFSINGAGGGALGGVACGLVLRLCGMDTLFCALLPVCGALAGALGAVSRAASAVGMLAGISLVSAWCFGFMEILPEFSCALIAGILFAFLPEAPLRTAGEARDGAGESADRALLRLRADLRRQTEALAGVFADLSTGYAQQDRLLPSEGEMIAQLREKLCAGCPSYTACWADGDGTAGRLLCQLLSLTFSGALIGEEAILPPEFGRQCRRAAQIPRRVGAALSSFDARRRAELKRTRLSSLMAGQFDQARVILERSGSRIENGAQPDPALALIGRAALEKEGLRAEHVYAISGEIPEICARLVSPPEDPGAIARAAQQIGSETGCAYEGALSDRHLVRFRPMPQYRVRAGWRSVPGHADSPNGDSRAALRLSDGRVLFALSDGMGSGERAGRESAETLRLITRFLQAGIEPCAAIDAINELMLLRSGEDMYSTVDLCLVDASGACAELIKLGACRSYLLRGGACVRIEGGRLPLGILEEVRPVRRSVPLHRGDLLVMATDGLESGDEDEWIVELLYSMEKEPPQKIADALVREALQRSSTHIDDTTVLAIRVA